MKAGQDMGTRQVVHSWVTLFARYDPDIVITPWIVNTSSWYYNIWPYCRHLEEVWGASKSLWSSLWAVVYSMCGESPFYLIVFGECVCVCVCEPTVTCLYGYCVDRQLWFSHNNPSSLLPLSSTGSHIVSVSTFILSNTFFTFLDLTGKPEFMLKYKIQEEKTVPVRKFNGYWLKNKLADESRCWVMDTLLFSIPC